MSDHTTSKSFLFMKWCSHQSQWLTLFYFKVIKCWVSWTVDHAELKLEETTVFCFFFSNDIFLTFLENYWTRAYDYTNCNALLYPVIYESVHLCTLPVQLLSWAIISKLLFRDELCHAGKWDKKNVNEHAWMLVDEG